MMRIGAIAHYGRKVHDENRRNRSLWQKKCPPSLSLIPPWVLISTDLFRLEYALAAHFD